ncbi:MAG TPA: alkaline phosphatase family protein [Candidatus Elarobacter sp.]
MTATGRREGIILALAAAVLVMSPWQPRPEVALAAPTMADGFLARGKIDTVVIVVMENRSFDNIFGGDTIFGHPTPFPSATALLPSEIAGLMTTAPFAPDSGEDNWHNEFACLALGNFTSAQWKRVAQAPPSPCTTTAISPVVPSTQPFKYLEPRYRAIYHDIARKYTLGDAFFAVTSTDSYPAHQYIVAGQSVATYIDQSSNKTVVQIVGGQFSGGNGCVDARSTYPPYVTAPVLPTPQPSVAPTTAFTTLATTGLGGECYDVPTFADAILATQPAPISWGNFATVDDPGVFNGFHNIRRWWGMQWPASGSNVLFVAKNAALPNFSWVKPPCVDASDHPNTGNGGPAWVRDLVNAIGSTSGKTHDQWSRTAIFVLWDDWGGFYDHVPPPPQRAWDNLGPGFRTPFLLISPYSRPGSVIHTPATYGSVLRFVEDLYGVPSLNTVDANSPDLTGYFDFASTPRPFNPITATSPESWQAACQFTTVLDHD